MGIMLTRHAVPPAHDISRYKSSHVRCAVRMGVVVVVVVVVVEVVLEVVVL
jgi:hypothetical protein